MCVSPFPDDLHNVRVLYGRILEIERERESDIERERPDAREREICAYADINKQG